LGVLLKLNKIDKHDYFSQLIVVGGDMVGAVTITEESRVNSSWFQFSPADMLRRNSLIGLIL